MWLREQYLKALEKLSSALEALQGFFNPETSSAHRRLQIFWASLGVLLILILAFWAFFVFFKETARDKQTKEETPTLIESGYTKAGNEGAWRYGIETSLKVLHESVQALQRMIEEGAKDQGVDEPKIAPDIETRLAELERALSEAPKETASLPPSPQDPLESADVNPLLHKFTLQLKEASHASLKSPENTIPAGAFAKSILLSGLDASSAMNASSDPRPMLLRVIDPGTLPRRFQSNLKDCHCTAGAFGDLSSERIYARLEKLTCTDVTTGEIVESQVAGYIAGPDGKVGIRGVVASKDGQFLGRSLIGGMFAGLSNVANPQNRRGMANPFTPGGTGIPPISMSENFTSGMTQGASSALDRLSQYYIDRAEQLQPVIQVSAGQVVDIVFTEGVAFGRDQSPVVRNQNMKGKTNEQIP